eukprot:TRINITY_DN3502_c0_g2_i2.p2 TRINITY_DN3502_c0_g2~~TRINITY_DN3502_c0_g2_i2.p2  ORF type:complete len:153 (+),score=3.19 TRINITY_DN3502_c0_g2_i2:230-688(+)
MPASANPDGPHLLYTYSWRGKVFYIGLSYPGGGRPGLSWHHVTEDLIGRYRRDGWLPKSKWDSYNRPCNRVIAALYLSGCGPHDVNLDLWHGMGQLAGMAEEKRQMRLHHDGGCVLANIPGMPRVNGKMVKNSVEDILAYLGVPAGAHLLVP